MLKKIKALFPEYMKYPLWWLFKSPQRHLGWQTLTHDLAALFAFLGYQFIQPKKLQRISICTGIFNRSGLYLDCFLESVLQAEHQHLIELSVFDCGSTDVHDLETEIRKKWKGELTFHSEPVKFTRAYSFNKAVEQSKADIVFICDADMSVPSQIVSLCNHYTSKKLVWYPIVYYLYKDKPAVIAAANGHWMQYGGKGMLACRKSEFTRVGKLNETFTQWGKEDDELWERFMKSGYHIIRNRQRGLLHHWHKSFNPKYSI